MNTRRELLVTLTAATLAGCTAQGGTQSEQNESTEETEGGGGGSRGDLTAGVLHDQHIGDVPGEIDENALLETYVQARQENGIVHATGQTLRHASQQLEDLDTDYNQHHKAAIAATQKTLGNQHQLYSLHSKAKSTTHGDSEFNTTKVWLEGHEDIDINAALTPDTNHAVHIENTQAEGPHEDVLKEFRNPERWGHLPAHDKEALDNSIEHYRENRGREYNAQDIDEIEGYWLDRFDSHIWGDGMAVPVEGHWDTYHENLETLLPELNVQYATSENIEQGETAAFTVEDGEVEVYQAPDDYDPATDGILTEEEIR